MLRSLFFVLISFSFTTTLHNVSKDDLPSDSVSQISLLRSAQSKTVFLNQKGGQSTSQKININTASASELTKLPGIGDSKAKAIVSHREANGPFKSIEDITNVRGIGSKTFQSFRDQITVGNAKSKTKNTTKTTNNIGKTEVKPSKDAININTASVSEITKLPGIGDSKAKAIVEHRSKNGAFSSCNDLVQIRGIGAKTVQQFEHLCRVK